MLRRNFSFVNLLASPLCGNPACVSICALRTAMTQDEYEQRKRRLEADLRSGIELLQTAYQTQLRALELVRMATSPGPVAPPPSASPPTPGSRRSYGTIYPALRAALPQLPEVFDRNDVCVALGHEPDRATLHRSLMDLVREGLLRIEVRGLGRSATKYRRT